MKEHVPQWRWDNLFSIVVVFLTWAFSFGILYTKVDFISKTVEEQKQMWLQLERRVGYTEISIAKSEQFDKELKNILKLQ